MAKMFDKIDEKITTPILIGFVSLLDFLIKRIIHAVSKKVECKLGDHEWKFINETKRYCEKCGLLDNVTIDGLENSTKKTKKAEKENAENEN